MKVGIAFMVMAIFTGIINHFQTTRNCVLHRMKEEDEAGQNTHFLFYLKSLRFSNMHWGWRRRGGSKTTQTGCKIGQSDGENHSSCKADEVDILGKSNSDVSASVFHEARSTQPKKTRWKQLCLDINLRLT